MELLLITIIASLVLLGIAAVRWGVDSRPVDLDPRYRTANGLG